MGTQPGCISYGVTLVDLGQTLLSRSVPIEAGAHSGEELQVPTKILTREPYTSARKALNVFWVTAKNPKSMSKEGCVAQRALRLP